jgi:protein-S-isoprenylcysteine O-methyltransferase Ste14
MRLVGPLFAPILLLALLGGVVPWRIACAASGSGGESTVARVAGILLALGGLGLALRAALLLADARDSPLEPSAPSGRFVVRGPYRRIRHPFYAGIVLIVLGEAVALRSTALLVYAGAIGIALHLFVVFVEEPSLRRRFGDLHDAYRARVPAWIPGRGKIDAA